MGEPAENIITINYVPIPTIKAFHDNPAQIRCIVGPVGSGKTSGATHEVCRYLPQLCFERYGYRHTRWVIIRNTYRELVDTTQKTVFEWYPAGKYIAKHDTYMIYHRDLGITVEILFRACDRPEDVKKFKSLEVTGYWIDESIEVSGEVKRMLKNRIGRYPKRSMVRFGIETTNPPDVEHETYNEFEWTTPPPGPMPQGRPKKNHVGFWQPPFENVANLRPGYYDDLMNDYEGERDWIETYILAKPGMIVKGRAVINGFRRDLHVASGPLVYAKGTIYRGWDNSGNVPACVALQIVGSRNVQVLKEFTTEKQNIGDFTKRVVLECNQAFTGATYVDFGDPAGSAEYSQRNGGFTSNAKIMAEMGVDVQPSEQNFAARVDAVEHLLNRIDGILVDPSCIRLINGLMGGYHYPELRPGGIYADNPEKNKYSHVVEALQYALVKLFHSEKQKKNRARRQTHAALNHEPI